MKLKTTVLVTSVILTAGLTVSAASAADRKAAILVNGPKDLGTLGGSISQASGVDFLTNHVAGSSTTTGDAATHAVIWSGSSGAIADLGVLFGGTNSSAAGVTSTGVATGESDYSDPTYGLVTRAFLYRGSVMKMLGTLGGSQSYGNSINELNQIAGYATTPNDSTTHGFFYDPSTGGLADLGTLAGAGYNSAAFALNNFGLVAGSSDTGKFDSSGDPITDAVIWSVGKKIKISDLGTLGGTYAQANAINNFGQATGFSSLASGQTDAFAYIGGKLLDLGTLGGSSAVGLGINDFGVVVGNSNTTGDAASDAFFWTRVTGMIDLNSLLPKGSPWVLIQASGIDDEGRIVGYGTINGEFHAFIW